MDTQFHHFSITNFINKNKLLNPYLSPIIQRMMLFSITVLVMLNINLGVSIL